MVFRCRSGGHTLLAIALSRHIEHLLGTYTSTSDQDVIATRMSSAKDRLIARNIEESDT